MMLRVLVAALVAAAVAAQTKPRQYRIIQNADITGQDIPSKGKPFTQMCYKSPGYGPKQLTGYDAYGAMCDATPGCVAFTVPPGFTGCAYMKKAGKRESTKTRKDWFVGTSAVKAVTCRFEGNKCSMDQWAEPFYCCGGNHVSCIKGKCVNSAGRK